MIEIKVRVDHFVHMERDGEIAARLSATEATMATVKEEIELMRAAVEQNTSVDQSAVTLIEGIIARLDEAGANAEALAALRAELVASTNTLAASVEANTQPPTP